MSGENLSFDDKNISKSNFQKNKKPFIIDDTDGNEKLISKKGRLWQKNSFKYLIGFNANDDMRNLFQNMRQFTRHAKSYKKFLHFFTQNEWGEPKF